MKKYIIPIYILSILVLTGCTKLNNNDIENNNIKVQYQTELTPSSPIQFTEKIASFSTQIYDKSSNRMNNLKIGAEQLNNTIVSSNETFSFNDTVGPYNQKNGYLEAKIFDANGNVLDEYGGGICQISTTLYNAIKNDENFKILERHNHSRKVQYISDGNDATVSYGHLDFKFQNLYPFDIQIKTYVDENNVIIDIYK